MLPMKQKVGLKAVSVDVCCPATDVIEIGPFPRVTSDVTVVRYMVLDKTDLDLCLALTKGLTSSHRVTGRTLMRRGISI